MSCTYVRTYVRGGEAGRRGGVEVGGLDSLHSLCHVTWGGGCDPVLAHIICERTVRVIYRCGCVQRMTD